MTPDFQDQREELRREAKEQISKVQLENKKRYDLRRRVPQRYQVGDLVAIKRTQYGPGLKLKCKYLGPYQITKCKFNDTYDVKRVGYSDGPITTTSCAEYMKSWVQENIIRDV